MLINGVELPDLDVGDADVMEKYEKANDKIAEKMNNLKPEGKRRSELIKIQCHAIFEFFNDVFGEGTDKKVFGSETNLTTCINAYEAVISTVNKADEQLANSFKAKYQGNREQRRTQQKHQKHHNKKKQQYNKPHLVKNE